MKGDVVLWSRDYSHPPPFLHRMWSKQTSNIIEKKGKEKRKDKEKKTKITFLFIP